MTRQTLVPLLVLVLLPLPAGAEKLPVKVEPAKAGLDATKLTALRPRLQEYVDKHQMAGAVTVVGGHGHIGSIEVVGFADLEKKTPMRADTIFRIASETKIATTTAVMMLVDEGKLVVETRAPEGSLVLSRGIGFPEIGPPCRKPSPAAMNGQRRPILVPRRSRLPQHPSFATRSCCVLS